MKNKINLLVIIFLLNAIGIPAMAQKESVVGNEWQLSSDTAAKLGSFTGRYLAGKVYLKWTIAGQQQDGIYLIYRSIDGVNYENIGSKQGIGVPISKDIAYYFTDDKFFVSGTKYYRLVHVNKSLTYLASECVVVTDENSMVIKTE